MDEVAVLVLNHTFEPLHFTNARRAITLLLAGKAESVEGSPRVIRSPSRAFPLPAVIRLAVYIRKPFLDRVAFNKKNILRRDGYTCHYCNRRGQRLTVDHVLPRSRAGDTAGTSRAQSRPSRARSWTGAATPSCAASPAPARRTRSPT